MSRSDVSVLVVIDGGIVERIASMDIAIAMQYDYGEHGLPVEIPIDQWNYAEAVEFQPMVPSVVSEDIPF